MKERDVRVSTSYRAERRSVVRRAAVAAPRHPRQLRRQMADGILRLLPPGDSVKLRGQKRHSKVPDFSKIMAEREGFEPSMGF
nr:hypothetical protein [Thioalkalivibrio nitratireducens]